MAKNGIVIAAVVLLLVAFMSGNLNIPGLQSATPTSGGGNSALQVSGIPCPVESTTLTIGPTQDKFDSTQSTTTLFHAVYVNGVDRGLVADGGSLTVSPGDKLEVYYAAKNKTYLNDKAEFAIPCKGAIDTGSLNGGAWKVTKFANFSNVRVFNPDNGNINSATDNQSITANQVKNFRVEFEAASKQAFVTKYPMDVICDADKDQFSLFEIKGAGWTNGVPIPGIYTVGSTSNHAFTARYDPVAASSQGAVEDSKIVNGVLTVTAGGTNPAPTSVINCRVYAHAWLKDPDTGIYRVAINDQRNTANPYDQGYLGLFIS